MKGTILVKTRWEYYIASITGLLAIIGLFSWLMAIIIKDGFGFAPVSVMLVLLISSPYAFILFFSSMKTVEVTGTGLTISYIFQKHTNVIRFSDVVKMKSRRTETETRVRPRSIRDTFTLVLADGRVFEFSRSQFDQYDQLKTICWKYVKQ